MKGQNLLLTTALLLSLSAAGCSTGNVPVVEYQAGGKPAGRGTLSTAPRKQVVEGYHTVAQGETLYSIAWRYGWDYRSLAQANGIASPYTIRPGQRIHFNKGRTQVATQPAPPSTNKAPTPKPTPSKPAATPKPTPKPQPSTAANTGNLAWQWPAKGQVKQGFSTKNSDQRGLLLAGRTGDPVHAAAAGTVVYRGSGLTGYGNLLIIKHNDRWLSAYGHNDSLLVKEGEAVRAGQKIATMGATGTSTVQLHFEIRRDGQAVDPQQVLPRR